MLYGPTHQEARGAAPKTHGRGRSYVCPPLGADPATPFKSATYGQIKGVRSWGDFAPMKELYIQFNKPVCHFKSPVPAAL